jgi:hypothetical protein
VPVAELPFANSGRTSFPQWEGEALPISRTNGAVTFTLNWIESATGALCHARFEIRTNGVPDFSWQIGSIQARDATGNAFWGRSNVFTGLSTNRTFSLPGTLWPDERAWKLSVEFCRGTNFASNELWTTPAMTIQPFGKQLALGITNSMLSGSTIIVTSPQMTSTIPTHLRAVRPIAQVRAWLGPHFCHRRLFLVGVTDNQGRELESEPSGRPSIDGWQNFIFGVPKGAQTVRLTFAVRESEVIEFNFSAKSLVQNNEALH